MRRQCAVQLIQLLTAGGGDGDGDAQVFATLAFAQFNGGGVKRGVELVGNVGDGVHQAVHPQAHDFDGEKGWVLNQRRLGRGGLSGVGRCRSGGGWRLGGGWGRHGRIGRTWLKGG